MITGLKLIQEMIDKNQALLESLQIHPRAVLDKFETRAWKALETDPRIKVLGLNIRKFDAEEARKLNITRKTWWVIFKIKCPCGKDVQEILELGDLWKSNFSWWESYLTKTIYVHLKRDGLI